MRFKKIQNQISNEKICWKNVIRELYRLFDKLYSHNKVKNYWNSKVRSKKNSDSNMKKDRRTKAKKSNTAAKQEAETSAKIFPVMSRKCPNAKSNTKAFLMLSSKYNPY